MIIPDCDQEGSLALAGETGRWENKAIFLPFQKALPESPSVRPTNFCVLFYFFAFVLRAKRNEGEGLLMLVMPSGVV